MGDNHQNIHYRPSSTCLHHPKEANNVLLLGQAASQLADGVTCNHGQLDAWPQEALLGESDTHRPSEVTSESAVC